mmetsp:Transcript_27994/g.76049  ORF Transcript_27994/g.76049 Transcript_27994/m.76049 type:complete len:271 (+) Transcript_27994:1612-2424(+)
MGPPAEGSLEAAVLRRNPGRRCNLPRRSTDSESLCALPQWVEEQRSKAVVASTAPEAIRRHRPERKNWVYSPVVRVALFAISVAGISVSPSPVAPPRATRSETPRCFVPVCPRCRYPQCLGQTACPFSDGSAGCRPRPCFWGNCLPGRCSGCTESVAGRPWTANRPQHCFRESISRAANCGWWWASTPSTTERIRTPGVVGETVSLANSNVPDCVAARPAQALPRTASGCHSVRWIAIRCFRCGRLPFRRRKQSYWFRPRGEDPLRKHSY